MPPFVAAGSFDTDARDASPLRAGDQPAAASSIVGQAPTAGSLVQGEVEVVLVGINSGHRFAMLSPLRRPILAMRTWCSFNHPGLIKRAVAIRLRMSPEGSGFRRSDDRRLSRGGPIRYTWPVQGSRKTRGGRTTGIHALTDRLGRPLVFLLTGGQVADCRAGALFLEHLPACSILLADKGYDSDAIRRQIEASGAAVDIPPEVNWRWIVGADGGDGLRRKLAERSGAVA